MKIDKDKTIKELEKDVAIINEMISEGKIDLDMLNSAKQSLLVTLHNKELADASRIVDSIETEQDDLDFLDSLCEDGLMP
tara:strand:+ start:227 stop:466 length:240 start_codon:yes stop_codon:yes gene_type:complete